MSVFVRQNKITVRIGFQSDPIDRTKTRLMSEESVNLGASCWTLKQREKNEGVNDASHNHSSPT